MSDEDQTLLPDLSTVEVEEVLDEDDRDRERYNESHDQNQVAKKEATLNATSIHHAGHVEKFMDRAALKPVLKPA